MKKIFFALFVVLFATSMMAQTGLTCEDAIPVDKNYVGTIEEAGEYWFTAYTYDLPLNVHFSPVADDSEWGPEVYVDFTCTEGVYDDPKLDSVINGMTDFGLTLPVEFSCDRVVRNGKVEWDLSINENYRENLTRYGIIENVQAFVKVYFSEPGEIRLKPDTSYQSCMENERVSLGDTLEISPNDADRVLIFPYSEWKKDSIQFTWIGDGSVDVWVSDGECDFIPASTSAYVKAHYVSTATAPHKLQSADIDAAIQNWLGGGVYFAKVMSKSAGKLVVEKIPLGPIQGDAILLKHNQSVELSANDARVFCFPKSWNSTEFVSSASEAMTVYIAKGPDFELNISDVKVIKSYPFFKNNNQRVLQLSSTDISSLGKSASDDYLYVRFQCDAPTTIIPIVWNASLCANQSNLITFDTYHTISARSSSVLYRIRYKELQGYDFTINWTGNSRLPIYIADTCNFMLSSTDSHVLWNANIASRGSRTVEKSISDVWASRVGSEGFLYIRFNPTNQGSVLFQSIKPVLDPVYSTIDVTLCYGEVYEWNGQVYSKSGEYSQTFTAANGADSIVTLKLTIRPEVAAVEEKDTVCYGESYTWQGTTYTESGEYSITLQDENGCDYQAVLNLTVLPEVADTTETAEVPFGETYTWHGTTYAESGSYTITLQDASGCDYQATLHLTVLPEPEKTDLLPNDALSVSLPTALNVYAMDYAAWKAQDVKWQWTGSTPLYVFVAKSSDYALTPQNRHVLLFAPIEPGEEIVLTKEQVSAWESLAQDGMIYVRLLTEKSGQLTTVAE